MDRFREASEYPVSGREVGVIKFELNILPKMANGSHGNWRAEAGRKAKLKEMVGEVLLGQIPKTPFPKAFATFTRCSSCQPDYDGLVHGFKTVRDALKKFGVITDDHPDVFDAKYLWEKAKPKCGGIKVSCEEVK
jgi:hypothetical protein